MKYKIHIRIHKHVHIHTLTQKQIHPQRGKNQKVAVS